MQAFWHTTVLGEHEHAGDHRDAVAVRTRIAISLPMSAKMAGGIREADCGATQIEGPLSLEIRIIRSISQKHSELRLIRNRESGNQAHF